MLTSSYQRNDVAQRQAIETINNKRGGCIP